MLLYREAEVTELEEHHPLTTKKSTWSCTRDESSPREAPFITGVVMKPKGLIKRTAGDDTDPSTGPKSDLQITKIHKETGLHSDTAHKYSTVHVFQSLTVVHQNGTPLSNHQVTLYSSPASSESWAATTS